MNGYSYSPATGEYIETITLRESPLEPGVFLVPALCTTTALPEVPAGHAACWNGAATGVTSAKTSADAGTYGANGGAGITDDANLGSGGGSGAPVGANWPTTGIPPSGCGGGIFGFICPSINWSKGCVASSDGSSGGGWTAGVTQARGGAGSGAGIIFTITEEDGLTNLGTFQAAGGLGGPGIGSYGRAGGSGGVGSVTHMEVPKGTK